MATFTPEYRIAYQSVPEAHARWHEKWRQEADVRAAFSLLGTNSNGRRLGDCSLHVAAALD